MLRFQCGTDPLTRHAPGTASASEETIVTGDSVYNDADSHTQTNSVVRHFDGDVTVRGTLVADNILYNSTFGTSDPDSKCNIHNLSLDQAAAMVENLDVIQFQSKLDPTGRTQWGFNAAQVEDASNGEFVRRNKLNGYRQMDHNSVLAGFCLMTKWLLAQHKAQTEWPVEVDERMEVVEWEGPGTCSELAAMV
jgi:hypothetical protein